MGSSHSPDLAQGSHTTLTSLNESLNGPAGPLSEGCIHIHMCTPPRRTTPDGETTSPRGGGRRSEEKEKGMTQGVLSFHGALLSMIEPFFFTFRPNSFTFVQLEVSER